MMDGPIACAVMLVIVGPRISTKMLHDHIEKLMKTPMHKLIGTMLDTV